LKGEVTMSELSLPFDERSSEPPLEDWRGPLFGDVPLAAWSPHGKNGEDGEPWISFATARAAVALGNARSAVAALHRVVASRHVESRHYLQAWHFLRELGECPPVAEAKRVHGVVLEMHLEGGVDTLSAYADRTARYLHRSGKVIVWHGPGDRVSVLIDRLIEAGQCAANVVTPWEQPHRGAPPRGHARIHLLTASGLHVEEGPFAALREDRAGGSVIAAGTELVQALIAASE
jgi:hypothetical protein